MQGTKLPLNTENSKLEAENLQKRMPVEVIKVLFQQNKLHLSDLYILITRDRNFSGQITNKKIHLAAEMLGKSRRTICRQLEELCNLNLADKFKNKYMAVGANQFTVRCARSRVKMARIPENVNWTNLAYSVIKSEQFYRKSYEVKKNCKTTQDANDELQRIAISSSYTRMHLRCNLGIERSESTIRRQMAKSEIRYSRQKGVKTINGKMMSGGNRVRQDFMSALIADELPGNEFLVQKRNRYIWAYEEAPIIHEVLHFSCRGVSGAQKKAARERYERYARIRF